MVQKKPVSVRQQTILTLLIPFGFYYAYYRIQKLRRAALHVIVAAIEAVVVERVLEIVFDIPMIVAIYVASASFQIVSIIISIKEIRKLSREWNKQFDHSG